MGMVQITRFVVGWVPKSHSIPFYLLNFSYEFRFIRRKQADIVQFNGYKNAQNRKIAFCIVSGHYF